MSITKQMQLKKDVTPFENIDPKKSVKQLFTSFVPLVLLWYGSYLSLSVSYVLSLALGAIAAGFVIRTFIIFHDCCHQSFFKNRKANKIIGTIAGAITLTPYEQWKYSHSVHHATSSNLDKRGIGDIWILTVEEYNAASFRKKLQYRIYRNPLVMFGLGPVYVFLLLYRFNRRGAKRKERINTHVTNLLIAALYALLIWLVGWQAFLLVQVPIFWLSGAMGIWLFYVQHQFEESYFEKEDEWSYVQAAVEGSSYYKLPKLLQWLTGNIGFHHVHHLSPKVPNYRLEEAHNATPPLQRATTITLRTSLESLRFKLWDERNRRFVRFKDARAG
ncbi:fatty acid desaturase [Cohnella thailandensis]|uniref:Fatty acid desaturase n=1 Tax=Cohnella thailandensis TaxID=557557 RepID=A0A841SV68_9BACL|nr:fatty acid desaturase [Cohnella thailandensis]MBB6634496.1 fatty acid desaturase [Cohnella thailandensis]MBP1972950.1 omega-6 fatty acid desaturase (delta-12 desaturase) [Cohnella thailandensis]